MPTVSQCLILMNKEGVDPNLSKRRYSGVNSNVSMPNLFLTSEKEEPCELPKLFDTSAGPNHKPYQLVVNGYQGTMSYDTKEHIFKWKIHSKDASSSVRPKRKISYTMANNSLKKSENCENSLSLTTSRSIMKMMESCRSEEDLPQQKMGNGTLNECLEDLGFRKRNTRVKSAFRRVEASDNKQITGIPKDINYLPTPPGAPSAPAQNDVQLMTSTNNTAERMPNVLSTAQESVCTCSRNTPARKQLDYTKVQICTPWNTPKQSNSGNPCVEQVPDSLHRIMEREYRTQNLVEKEHTSKTIDSEFVPKGIENGRLFRPIHYEYVKKNTDVYSKFEHVRKRTENAKERVPIHKAIEQEHTSLDYVPIFIPTENSYIQSSSTDVTENQSSQESVDISFMISVDIQLKSTNGNNDQIQTDTACKRYVHPVTHKLKKLPESDPTAVCFSIHDNVSHQDVTSLVKLQTGYDAKSVQYDPVFIRAGHGNTSRWIVKFQSTDVCKLVIKTGLEWKGYKIIVKSLDEVYLSEYTRYYKENGSDDDKALKQKISQKHVKAKKSKTKSIKN